ncbi:short-chain dehydrogenase/reductase SDR [Geobacter metallireducens RCH3]|uniref:3-oxoacyl-(Acyl carrier protein) reductase n=1 Tax=Geobacter metallireducens (strain ATCC 53774 / DSM 7210 / GS-15) TaxID=269799 RepID=Q39UZ9_GEOMG|nr:3-oxoacyl-ACP reductase FabG [Geobacter metallireducens]ABB31925.1 3-oxoacyl-(acyl carrier protein) reductase [Geobacter metallireducens GS-15]EHP84973.1 short-chain dehydrogenase/reductase SDR [Geobacter metallireducens RCH3]
MEFAGNTIVVTGGTRGIGRAIALRFAREGARVFAAYLRNENAAREVAAEAAGLSGEIVTLQADVSTQEGAQGLIETAAASGTIDILINNAGIIRDGYLAMMADDDWDAVIRGNLYPLFHCCKWGIRKMMANRRGAIVNVSSISGIAGTAGQTNYAASKGGIISFTKALARETGPMGIRVNAVVPGLIETEMIAGMKRDMVDRIVAGAALGRLGTTCEVADAVAFLASDRATYITGQSLVVDGGIL